MAAAAAATTTKTADTTGTRGETARSRSSSNNKGSEEPEAARERARARERDAEVLLQRRRETERQRRATAEREPPQQQRRLSSLRVPLRANLGWARTWLSSRSLACCVLPACLPATAAARRHPAASARASSWGKQVQVGPRPKFLCARDRERAREIVLPRPERTINPSNTRFKVAASSFDSAPSETDRTPPR